MAIVINSLTPENPSTIAGTSIEFIVDAYDDGGLILSYQWQFSNNGGVTYTANGLTGNTTAVYTTSNLTSNQSGLYFRVAISNGITTVYSNEYPGIGNRIVTVISAPQIITQVNPSIDNYPDTAVVEVAQSLTFTASATVQNVDVSNPNNLTGLSFQWQYSKDNGLNWISTFNNQFLDEGAQAEGLNPQITIQNVVSTLTTNPLVYYKYSQFTLSATAFAYNNFLWRSVVSYSGASNTPVTLPDILLLVSPEITIYRQPGTGNDTTITNCYKTSISGSGNIKVEVGALTTANSSLNYKWQLSIDDGASWTDITDLLSNYLFIIKPGTTTNAPVLELERTTFFNTLGFRCVVTGTSGEAEITSSPHYVYMTDIEEPVEVSTNTINVIEDKYGDIPTRNTFSFDPIITAQIGEFSLDYSRNTGLNGEITISLEKQIFGSNTWSEVSDFDEINTTLPTTWFTYTRFPSQVPTDVANITYVTPPVRKSVDDKTKYRLKILSSSLFTLNNNIKTLTPYYSPEITLNVYRTVYIINQPAPATVFPNQSASFSVNAIVSSGVDDIQYQWQYSVTGTLNSWQNIPNSPRYSGINTNLLIINSVPRNITYPYYRCVLSLPDGLATVTSQPTILSTTRDLFTEITSINDVYANQYDNITYEVTASSLSQGPISYQWQLSYDYNPGNLSGNWIDIIGETTNELSLLSVQPSDQAYYRLKLTSFGGEVAYTNVARVIVYALAITVTRDIPSSITVLEGVSNAYTFECEGVASNGSFVNYQWQKALSYTEISGTQIQITSGQSYSISGTSYPVYGILYVPTSLPATSIDVVVCYHGTIEGTATTIMQAAQTFMNYALSDSILNLKDKIIFSVAYPQDAIPAANQFGIGGLEDPNFIFESNLPYARASLLWAKNSLNAFMASNGIAKTIDKVFTFGHSQGGALVHKLNTLETVDGVICNAPGPIRLDLTCSTQELSGNLGDTCRKMQDIYGSARGVGSSEYLSRSVISYDENLLSPMLYIQGQQDTTGNNNQIVWLEQLLYAIDLNDSINADYTYLPVNGQHAAFITSLEAQVAIRNFVNSSASSPNFQNIGAGFNNSSDTSRIYAPLAFDRISDNLCRIRCKMTASGIPNESYTTQCTVGVTRRFTYFADRPTKFVTNGSTLFINLNPTWTGGEPSFMWQYSSNGGSTWIDMNETDTSLVIPNIDNSYNGRIYRCRVTLPGCNEYSYTRNNVNFVVPASEVGFTLPITISVVASGSRSKYYSLETQKTGAAVGTVIAIPKPSGFINNPSINTDDVSLWEVSVSGDISPTGNVSSSVSSGSVYNANKPSWTSSSYTSPKWLQQRDRFQGYVEMRGQYLRAREFPELARILGTSYGGSISGSYPIYNSNDTFRMPNMYGKRLLGTGNVNNNSGSISITPLYNPDGTSGGDKNVPGSMGGVYNYVKSAQLPPGSPGVGGEPDGTADGSINAATFSLGTYRTTGFEEVNSFVQPVLSNTLATYRLPSPFNAFTQTPLHNHSAVSVAYEERRAVKVSCRGNNTVLNPSGPFFGTSGGQGEILEGPHGTAGGSDHGHTAENPGGTFDIVRDGGQFISDTTLRMAGQSRQIFDNNLRFTLRNNEEIPMNAPYFRLKYIMKAY